MSSFRRESGEDVTSALTIPGVIGSRELQVKVVIKRVRVVVLVNLVEHTTSLQCE